jgi:chaperone required for assembly of F1-ATPase
MKRFYRSAGFAATEAGVTVTLDGKPVKTPLGRALLVPTEPLAAAIAEEWDRQDEQVKPSTMPLMQLACTALDRVANERTALIAELVNFARSDLLCYRAPHPWDLVERQALLWQPLLDWAATEHDIGLVVAEGILPISQPAGSLAALERRLASFDDWTIAAQLALAPPMGSIILALALTFGLIDAGRAFELSQLDETFQAERWGADDEAVARRTGLRQEIHAAARYLKLVRAV